MLDHFEVKHRLILKILICCITSNLETNSTGCTMLIETKWNLLTSRWKKDQVKHNQLTQNENHVERRVKGLLEGSVVPPLPRCWRSLRPQSYVANVSCCLPTSSYRHVFHEFFLAFSCEKPEIRRFSLKLDRNFIP